MLRGLRAYRDDRHLSDAANSTGFVVGRVTPYAEVRYDWLPQENDLVDRVRLWGAAGQYVAGTVAVRALEPLAGLRVTLDEARRAAGNEARLERRSTCGSPTSGIASMTLPATRPYSDEFPRPAAPRRPHRFTPEGQSGRLRRRELRSRRSGPPEPPVLDHRPRARRGTGRHLPRIAGPVGREELAAAKAAARRGRSPSAGPSPGGGLLRDLLSVTAGRGGPGELCRSAEVSGRTGRSGAARSEQHDALWRLRDGADGCGGRHDPSALPDALAGQ